MAHEKRMSASSQTIVCTQKQPDCKKRAVLFKIARVKNVA